jgi:hypothetical protein
MYGEGHIYNNFFNSPGNGYCIGFGSYSSILVQNNYFKDVKSPHEFMYDVYAYAAAEGNVYDKTSGNRHTGKLGSRHVTGQEWATANPVSPPYKFTLDSVQGVPDLVKRCAGPRESPDSNPPTSTTTSNPPAATCAAIWGQCGGNGWTGPKCCSQGSCKAQNEWYSQCL